MPPAAPHDAPEVPEVPRDALGRRLDVSMDLLHTVRREAVDPDYAIVAARGPRRRRPLAVVAMLAVAGIVCGVVGASQFRSAPAAATERADLIARIGEAETRQDDLREKSAALTAENDALARDAGVLDADAAAERDLLAATAGMTAVSGPGVRVTLDDGADASVRGSRIVDADLRMVANGLWAVGAEAVGINGHRLSTRTPIRNAGDAITVDYRSLTRPYVVEAIGDADSLASAFPGTEGGQWMAGLAEHYGVSWGLTRERSLGLGADPGLGVERAQRIR